MNKRTRARFSACWLILWLVSPQLLWAHGGEAHGANHGENHGDESQQNPAQPAVTTAPARAVAASDLFELVLVAARPADQQTAAPVPLQIYLDHSADNSPVAGATITVDGSVVDATGKGAAFSLTAIEQQPGLYQLTLPALGSGQHQLALTVETADQLDLLSTRLDLPAVPAAVAEDAAHPEHSTAITGTTGWPLLLMLVAGGSAGWWLRGQTVRARPAANNCCAGAGKGGGACH